MGIKPEKLKPTLADRIRNIFNGKDKRIKELEAEVERMRQQLEETDEAISVYETKDTPNA